MQKKYFFAITAFQVHVNNLSKFFDCFKIIIRLVIVVKVAVEARPYNLIQSYFKIKNFLIINKND